MTGDGAVLLLGLVPSVAVAVLGTELVGDTEDDSTESVNPDEDDLYEDVEDVYATRGIIS